MLAGKKTMTRRLMKEQPPNDIYLLHQLLDTTNNDKRKFIEMYAWLLPDVIINYSEKYFKCPFSVGDVFYAKEAWQDTYQLGDYPGEIFYRSTYLEDWVGSATWVVKWRSPWHLKEINARIFRKITNIKAERLQDISEEDALKEGVMTLYSDSTLPFFAFENEWRNINGNNSWDQNPWVWVYEYADMEG
jgi:hypothetical protein